MSPSTTHLVVGPARHGVVTFALALADSLRRRDERAPVVRLQNWADLDDALADLDAAGGIHLNFTDRLFGPTPQEAADRVGALARHVESSGARLTATVHDVPQPVDGGNYRQRIDAYRAVCQMLHGIATNSEHERMLLSENGIAEPADVVVVPLPLDIGAAPRRPPADERRSVAVLGFVYPGKGHDEVLAAMAGLASDVEFLAIGECSAGHEHMAHDLAESARLSGRGFTTTGYVPDDELAAVLQGVSVPVAHHRHVSASGSLNTWIGAHRRPLVPENRYTAEHDRRHPGTVLLYPDTHDGLADAIESALAARDSTWLTDDVISGSPSSATGELYAAALARWHG